VSTSACVSPFGDLGKGPRGSPFTGGVGESSTTTCLNPPCFSWGAGAGTGMGAGAGGAVLLRESMPLMRSFEKSEGRFVSVVVGRPVAAEGNVAGG
jgi:hypothetical protein